MGQMYFSPEGDWTSPVWKNIIHEGTNLLLKVKGSLTFVKRFGFTTHPMLRINGVENSISPMRSFQQGSRKFVTDGCYTKDLWPQPLS